MKILILDGVIGWDVYGRSVRNQLKDAGGSPVEIHIASPGGFVYDGIEIFNILRDYNEKTAQVNIVLKGLAASMASYLAMSVPREQRAAEDNTPFMLHNVWSVIVGDYRDMFKEAKGIEALTNTLARGYAAGSGKSLDEIHKLMDDETWLYGEEIRSAGFVGTVLEHEHATDSDVGKDEALMLAKGRFTNMLDKLRADSQRAHDDISRAAALITTPGGFRSEPDKQSITNTHTNTPADRGGENREGVSMTLEELKAQQPNLCTEIFEEGRKAGEEKEHGRVCAHITMAEKTGATEAAFGFIRENKSVSDDEVVAEYLTAGLNKHDREDRQADDPGESRTGTITDDAEIDEETVNARVDEILGLKREEGK